MAARVYIETSVLSDLTSAPSRDVVAAGHQQVTHEWWTRRRPHFDLFVSDLVRSEAERGDPALARARLEALRDLPVLVVDEAAVSLSEVLVARGPLPR